MERGLSFLSVRTSVIVMIIILQRGDFRIIKHTQKEQLIVDFFIIKGTAYPQEKSSVRKVPMLLDL